MEELLPDNSLTLQIFDYLIIPSVIFGDQVRFGIQTHVSRITTNPRFPKLFFRTRRPLEDYQDFADFMADRHPDVIVPPLPFDEADPDEDRELLLEKVALLHEYCVNLFRIQEIFDDASVPLFLQSHNRMSEIRDIIRGQEAAAAANFAIFQRAAANDGNAEAAAVAAAANNEQQVPANDENAQQAAGNDQQAPANDGNAQQAAGNNDQQAPANDGNAQQAAGNNQQVPANDGNAQQAAANNQQVPAAQQAPENAQQGAAMGSQYGDGSSEEELTEGNLSEIESDESIFHMEDI